MSSLSITNLSNQLVAGSAYQKSRIFVRPAAEPEDAYGFFSRKLSYETDPSDVYADQEAGVTGFLLLDVRSAEAYWQGHARGALSLPHPTINAATTSQFDPDTLLIVYCWGPGCNGATKAAIKLSALGFRVKEMIGGYEYWAERENLPVVRG